MNQHSSLTKDINHSGHSDFVNLRKLLFLVFSKWVWFIIAILLAVTAAYFYNKFTLPSYNVSSTILIEGGDNARVPGIENNMLEGFGLRPGSQNLDNQILILTSWTLIDKALNELPFDINVYRKGLLKDVSFFPLNPINIIPGSESNVENIEFTFQYFQENIFQLKFIDNTGIERDTFLSFGQELKLPNGSFSILPHPEMEEVYNSGDKIYFVFSSRESLFESYRNRLVVSLATKDGTILKLSLEGPDKSKDIVFLDKLLEVFMTNNLEKKNHEASRIIEFIDEQLIDVTDSLMMTENKLQEFRSKNKIMNVSAQAQQIIDQAVVLDDEKARLTLESNYYNYLDEYLSKESNREVPISPSTMGILDPLLGQLMQELAGLQAEYFSSGVGERNPLQAQLELRIKNTKRSIQETLQGIKRANSMALDETNRHIRNLNAQASGLPMKERQLLGFERKFNLNNVLYTFLLQKRAEAQIQKASNRPDNELIDPARAGLNPIAPNKPMVYLFSILFLGIGIPLLIILISESVHNKISSEEDLKSITDLPIVGHIPHSRLSYNTVVLTEPQSRIAESYRSLRTRMEYITRQTKSPVILITSSTPGDGKTFSAINLASAYSLAGKKTLLVSFDLRKPTISKSFSMNGDEGLSTYLIGKSNIKSVIVDTGFPNLHILPSGPIPPNPGELSSSNMATEMFIELKKMYDYIIVDSAPIGVVADNYPVAAIADATLIMVRHSQTRKKFLGATIIEAQANGIHRLSLVVNDLRVHRNSYRYAYNNKYEYKQKK